MQSQGNLIPRRLEWAIVSVVGIALFFAFTFWGGVPQDDRIPQFWIQVLILFLVTALFIFVTWHLLVRPLPANVKQPERIAIPVRLRQVFSLLLAGGGLSLVVGPFWDELWHRTYGIPFGEDFFWRPHLLIYFGFGVGIFTGFWGLYYLNRHFKGSFQQRFRTNPIVSLLILNAAFLMYVVPADPLWHKIYGRDLSAWSIPHILLLISIGMTMLLAVYVHLSTIEIGDWRTILNIRFSDVLPLIMFAGIMMPWLQILVIDWDQVVAGDASRLLGRFRPEWLLAACILGTAIFSGVMATRVLRCVGAATLVGLIALGLRYSMIQIFHAETMQYVAWVVALMPLIAIDIWTYYSVHVRKQESNWVSIGVVAAIAMIINLPVIRSFYAIEASSIVVYALAVLATSLGMSWLSHQIADQISTTRKPLVIKETQSAYRPLLSIGSLGGFIVFIIFFIVTAVPPV